MLYSKGKISLRQAMFLLITLVFSPLVRLIPNYAARHGEQASWLIPIICIFVMIPTIYMFQSIYKSFKNVSFMEVMDSICGKIIGKFLTTLYIIWITILTALYVRYYAERLLSTILPNVNILIFIVLMIVTVAIILRSSMVVIARMNEIFLPIILVLFSFCVIFSLPDIKLSRLTPVSTLDALPILRGSMGILAIWGYLPFIFLFSNIINDKEHIKKIGMQTITVLVISTILAIAVPIGILGASTIKMMPIPFFAAVRQIELFDTIERIESFVVSLWLISDFILISVFTFMVMDMLKSIFNLSDAKPLVSIYLVIIFILSLYISKDVFELQKFSDDILIPLNLVFGFVIPTLVFIVGKIRKKV